MTAFSSEQIPDPLLRLTGVLSTLLGQELPSDGVVDEALVRFADQRQRVGLLLLAARDRLPPAQRAMLERKHAAHKRRRATEYLQLVALGQRFDQRGMPWLILKGLPLAAMLYPDPTWRASADIDILVPPGHFADAVNILRATGWQLPAARGVISKIAMRSMKDVELKAPGGAPFRLELHQRPYFAEPFGHTGADLFKDVTRDPLPSPRLGPGLVYYLFGHGALSYWCRLRWLLDFALILPKLDHAAQMEVVAIAELRRTTHSLAASLLLTKRHFPASVSEALASWADSRCGDPRVIVRFQRYVAALQTGDAQTETPLGSRYLSLQSALQFDEDPLRRMHILLSSPTASLFRHLAGFGHGQAAGSRQFAGMVVGQRTCDKVEGA